VCVTNNFRCKIPHVKAFFAVLTGEQNGALFSQGERELIRKHIPWTRVVADVKTAHYGQPIELLAFIRKERENMVLKPSDEYGGSGVTLGWETSEAAWDAAIQLALSAKNGVWIAQERIPIRREIFPYMAQTGKVDYRDMLVDFAPYPPQRHRPRQCDQRRRPGSGFSRLPAELGGQRIGKNHGLRVTRDACTSCKELRQAEWPVVKKNHRNACARKSAQFK